DAGAVKVQVPAGYVNNLVGLVAQIEGIPVSADVPAKVVFNEQTGTVVIGGSVRILPAVVSHGSLRVQISGGEPSQGTVAGGQSQGTQGEPVQASPTPTQKAVPGAVFSISSVDTVDALVAAMNSVGATPRDIIAILQALKACGSLLAEIEVL
ncbi:MAG: flagellar basal body P-ring protein FlgI, partial [Bacillota bacterium]